MTDATEGALISALEPFAEAAIRRLTGKWVTLAELRAQG